MSASTNGADVSAPKQLERHLVVFHACKTPSDLCGRRAALAVELSDCQSWTCRRRPIDSASCIAVASASQIVFSSCEQTNASATERLKIDWQQPAHQRRADSCCGNVDTRASQYCLLGPGKPTLIDYEKSRRPFWRNWHPSPAKHFCSSHLCSRPSAPPLSRFGAGPWTGASPPHRFHPRFAHPISRSISPRPPSARSRRILLLLLLVWDNGLRLGILLIGAGWPSGCLCFKTPLGLLFAGTGKAYKHTRRLERGVC
jgi:hypothetical protein